MCFTEAHAKGLRTHVAETLFRDAQDESDSGIYNASFAAAIKEYLDFKKKDSGNKGTSKKDASKNDGVGDGNSTSKDKGKDKKPIGKGGKSRKEDEKTRNKRQSGRPRLQGRRRAIRA